MTNQVAEQDFSPRPTSNLARLAGSPMVRTGLRVLRLALNIVALVGIGLYFVTHRVAIREAAAQVETPAIVLAMVTVLVGLVPGAWAWQQLCARRLPGVGAAHGILVYLRSAIGKYTPGGVLTFVVQQRMLGRYGSTPALLVQTFVGAALAAVLAAAVLGGPAALAFDDLGGEDGWIVAGALVVALAVLLPVVAARTRIGPPVARIWARTGLPPVRPMVRATLLLAIATALTGVHLAVLGAGTGGGVLFLVSAYALSTIVGLAFAVLPGAAGARDGALILILATRLAPGDAAMLALLSRALIVAGDALGALVSAAVLRLAPPAERVLP